MYDYMKGVHSFLDIYKGLDTNLKAITIHHRIRELEKLLKNSEYDSIETRARVKALRAEIDLAMSELQKEKEERDYLGTEQASYDKSTERKIKEIAETASFVVPKGIDNGQTYRLILEGLQSIDSVGILHEDDEVKVSNMKLFVTSIKIDDKPEKATILIVNKQKYWASHQEIEQILSDILEPLYVTNLTEPDVESEASQDVYYAYWLSESPRSRETWAKGEYGNH